VNDDTFTLCNQLPGDFTLETVTKLDKFLCSPFRQEIELQQVEHEAGFTTLRIRIRERSRFTIFEIDQQTATTWGEALLAWAKTQGEAK
jgi:hypothetical protein